jgi:ribonuclease HII
VPLVVGIDEAGYGPALGPLVIGASCWMVRPDRVDSCYWRCLDTVLVNGPDAGSVRLPVADSKLVYDRDRGICTLERSVLAFAHALDHPHATLAEWLASLGVETPLRSQMPWYQILRRPLPCDPQRSAYAGVSARLRKAMAAAGVECRALRVAIIPEDAFNERVRATRNKASIVVEHVLQHMQQAAALAPDADVYFRVDRLGGRTNYRTLLQESFPDRALHELEVTPNCSRYRLSGRNDWYVEFRVDADRERLPVALASMVAKYIRELLMMEFNDWWRRHEPALKPTAGYRNDADRFLRDIAPILPNVGLEPDRFARLR